MVGVSKTTLTLWYKICREICSKDMRTCAMEVGGYGCIVEIDETSVRKRESIIMERIIQTIGCSAVWTEQPA